MAGDPVAGPREPSKLEAVRQARRAPLDEARPAAIARHKAKGRLTARENVADLLDAGSFAADTRRLLAQTLARLPAPPPRVTRKHPVDPF